MNDKLYFSADDGIGFGLWILRLHEPLPGGVNNDHSVDLRDFNVLKSHFGATNATRAQGDLNGDGVVDLLNFNVLKSNFGRTASLTAAHPSASRREDLGEAEYVAAALSSLGDDDGEAWPTLASADVP